jgi:hypothetical protein
MIPRNPGHRALAWLLLLYGTLSLVHFVHNAEFLADYPNLPSSWSRGDVYGAWVLITSVGLVGWLLISRGHAIAGLVLLAAYGALGLDSLGHYVLAPVGSHTAGMNVTIFGEVIAAGLVVVEVTRQLARNVRACK